MSGAAVPWISTHCGGREAKSPLRGGATRRAMDAKLQWGGKAEEVDTRLPSIGPSISSAPPTASGNGSPGAGVEAASLSRTPPSRT